MFLTNQSHIWYANFLIMQTITLNLKYNNNNNNNQIGHRN